MYSYSQPYLLVQVRVQFPHSIQSRTQSNACARARMALAPGKLNFSCAVIGLTFVNRACRQRTGTPKFRGSGCQFPQSQCHPSPRTGIALGTRLHSIVFMRPIKSLLVLVFARASGNAVSAVRPWDRGWAPY